MMIVALALFLTWFVMEPVFTESWDNGVEPLLAGTMNLELASPKILGPFRTFMEKRVSPETMAVLATSVPSSIAPADGIQPLRILVPAFLLTEVQRGFEVGFLIFLPFLIIDLVVAAVLMSMGMMMVPPAAVSLPFKLVFFVLADGWSLLAGALIRSYN